MPINEDDVKKILAVEAEAKELVNKAKMELNAVSEKAKIDSIEEIKILENELSLYRKKKEKMLQEEINSYKISLEEEFNKEVEMYQNDVDIEKIANYLANIISGENIKEKM